MYVVGVYEFDMCRYFKWLFDMHSFFKLSLYIRITSMKERSFSYIQILFCPNAAPTAALLVNSCVIAIRSTLSKFVTGDELGKC